MSFDSRGFAGLCEEFKPFQLPWHGRRRLHWHDSQRWCSLKLFFSNAIFVVLRTMHPVLFTFKRTISCKAHQSNNNKPWMSVFVISDLFVICFVKIDKHLFWWSSCFWSCIIKSVIEWYGVWEIPVDSSTLWCCLQLHLQLLARILPLWYLYHTHGISEIQCLQVSVRFFSMHSCIISKWGSRFRALRIVFVFMLLMWLKSCLSLVLANVRNSQDLDRFVDNPWNSRLVTCYWHLSSVLTNPICSMFYSAVTKVHMWRNAKYG